MDEILTKIGKLIQDPGMTIDTTGFVFAIVISVLCGTFISILYQIFYENRATGSQIHRSFVLISPSITALFIAIQYSLPLSLGLLGALSFIRFRTPIKEPEEIGYMMVLIATSVICATFQFLLLFVLLLIVFSLLSVKKYFPALFFSKRRDGLLLVTISGKNKEHKSKEVGGILAAKLTNVVLQSISFTEDITTIYYSFNGIAEANIDNLFRDIQEKVSIQKLNIVYNREGLII